jgi:hypothetical protein
VDPQLPGEDQAVTDYQPNAEAIEKAARALAGLEDGEPWPTNAELGGNLTGTRDDEYHDAMTEDATTTLSAAYPALRAQIIRELAEKHRAELAEAWAEGAQDEADRWGLSQDEAEAGERAITFTCSMDNPYLEWTETETGVYTSTPTSARAGQEETL